MNKDYNEKLDYLMKYLSKESIATMLLNTSEGDKLVSNYIEIRQIENITNLKKVKVEDTPKEDKKIEKIQHFKTRAGTVTRLRLDLETINNRFENKIKELQDRIDEAIEYIKHYGNLYCLKNTQFKNYAQYKKILEILEGEDNESN